MNNFLAVQRNVSGSSGLRVRRRRVLKVKSVRGCQDYLAASKPLAENQSLLGGAGACQNVSHSYSETAAGARAATASRVRNAAMRSLPAESGTLRADPNDARAAAARLRKAATSSETPASGFCSGDDVSTFIEGGAPASARTKHASGASSAAPASPSRRKTAGSGSARNSKSPQNNTRASLISQSKIRRRARASARRQHRGLRAPRPQTRARAAR